MGVEIRAVTCFFALYVMRSVVLSCFHALAVLSLCVISGALLEAHAEDDIHGSARLSYTSAETETDAVKEHSWQFTQFYNLGLKKAFTSKMAFSADLDVNVKESNEEKTTFVAPDLRLDVTNEYFDANTGYRLQERGLDVLTMVADETRRTKETWNANLTTKVEKYPKVQLRFNQDKDYDHLTVPETDSETTNFTGSADYSFRFLNFYYEYRNDQADNYVDEISRDSDTHEGRLNYRKSFLDSKLTTSGSYTITDRDTETQTGGQDVDVDEIQRAVVGLYADDPTDPTNVSLTSEPLLIDGNKIVSTGIEIGTSANENQNIGLDLSSPKDVEKIFVYTEEPGNLFDETQYTWAVYSGTDNLNWTLITSSATFDYDDDENRFEITFTKTKERYFKVVNTANDGNSLNVTEIEAYDVTTFLSFTTTTEDTTTEVFQANFGYKPWEWLSFTYDFARDELDNKTDSEDTRDEAHTVSGRIDRDLHKYLSAWTQYRRRWAFQSEADDTTTDTYLLHFVSSPLDTLSAELSFNHTVLKEESDTQTRTSSALLETVARLCDGADLKVTGNIIYTDNLAGQSETTTKFIDTDLRLVLTKMLTAEIEYNRTWTEIEQATGDTDEETSLGEANLYWRPSHEFYLRGTFRIARDEKTGEEDTQQQYNMNWLLTEKMQLDMRYTLDNGETEDRQTYRSDLSWNFSRALTLRIGYDWSRQESDTVTKTQSFTSDLSARF
jgi:hypothetical protein